MVDPTRCTGVGVCAHLAADLVSMDDWGFPIVAGTSLPGNARRRAVRAVRACPRSALLLVDRNAESRPVDEGSRPAGPRSPG